MAGKLENVTDYRKREVEDDNGRTKHAFMQKTQDSCQEGSEAS